MTVSRRRKGALSTPLILTLSDAQDDDGNRLTVKEALIAATRDGHRRHIAAAYAGIAPSTFTGWLDEGAAALQRALKEKQANTKENPDDPHPTPPDPRTVLDDIPNTPKPFRDYAELALEVPRAGDLHVKDLEQLIFRHAARDWKAGVAALVAAEQGRWSPPSKIELTGPAGGRIGVAATLDDTGVARLVASLQERRAAALEVGEV